MKSIFTIFFLFLFLGLFSQWNPSEYIFKKSNKELLKIYKDSIKLKSIDNSSSFFYIVSNKKNIGYFRLQQALSKHDVFDYMVVFDNNINIKHIKILAYREDYGGEISAKRWLSQFYNRNINDVQAISGATISVNSLKNNISKLKQEIEIWAEKQK